MVAEVLVVAVPTAMKNGKVTAGTEAIAADTVVLLVKQERQH